MPICEKKLDTIRSSESWLEDQDSWRVQIAGHSLCRNLNWGVCILGAVVGWERFISERLRALIC